MGSAQVTLYEQVQRARLTARMVEDIYNPPIAKTVMLVDVRPRVRRSNGRCGVRVEKPTTPVMPEAVMRSAQIVRQSKGRGS